MIEPKQRPATVTVAFWLQLGAAAALMVIVALIVVDSIYYAGLIDRAAELTNAEPAEVSSERASNVAGAAVGCAVAVVLAVWSVATAVPFGRGSNVGRVLACVGAGLQLLCCVGSTGAGSLMFLFVASLPEDPALAEDEVWPADSAFYEKLYELDESGTMAWLAPVVPLAAVTVFLLSIAVGVLLLVPPSNRYFRTEPVPPAYVPYPYGYAVPVYYAYPPPQYGAPPAPPKREVDHPSPDVDPPC
ncbi:hypothetical protein [Phytohabitans rumicis]|uniref:Uncharacterized protein n=1 Tax=Phytohabitans rumicis TaxID=1076125 RepID=A0A6V8L4H6_9ACTN|nr:hypothetical protein [Phytohabitans rumicis]GFJ90450.1 hypothetical protein Prum_040920 [Phytohabitans rumicis]